MASIHVARSQQSLGSFGEEEVREGIRTGRFTAEDLVWREGMAEWKPLGVMASEWGWETPPPSSEVAGVSEPQTLPESSGTEPAWEDREKIGFFPAIAQTIQSVLLRPTETFASLKQTGGLANPLLYFVLLSSTTFAVSALYQLVATALNPALFAPQLQHTPRGAFSVILIGVILISPALYVVTVFLSSGVTHLCLKLLGGANRPFETTFRVICYAQASASVFNILPLFGGVIAIVWAAGAIIIGLKEAHGISGWKAALAFVLPGLLCCGFLLSLGVAAGISLAELGNLGK